GGARPWLGELGKRMVLRSLIQKHRDELCLFAKSAATAGFTERLAGTLAELKLYHVSPEMLAQRLAALKAAGMGESPLAGKLHDLALLYQELEAFLAPRYTDPEGYLTFLADRLPAAPSLQRAGVWVDGFAGFTPEEYQVLCALLHTAARVEITLCLDAGELNQPLAETDLFHPTRETYTRLRDLADTAGAQVEPPLILSYPLSPPPRFAAAPELAHLERSFFRYPTVVWTRPAPGLTLVAAANRRTEVEAAARRIIHLAREEGLRWREMALVVRDLELYHDLIVTTFADYAIPCFIDRKRPVLHHPLAQLALAALEVITTNWSYEAVFRCLKTDLLPLRRPEVDQLENYVLAFGVRGSAWQRDPDWDFHTRGDRTRSADTAPGVEVDTLRRRVAACLKPLTAACRRGEAVSATALTTALWRFLEDLQVSATLTGWAKEAEAHGDLAAVQEHSQVWTRFLELLDELVSGLGTTPLTPEEYAEVLASGLESLRLGLVPPSLDQVVVGGLERSRHPNVRAAFVLGVSDGVLPGRANEDAVFTDREREELRAGGLELAPTSRQRQFHEQYLTYVALTRGGERLWVSYPLADEEGRALAPSRVITRLRELYPRAVETYVAAEPSGVPAEDLAFVTSPTRAAAYLAGQLRLARAGQPLGPVSRAVQQYLTATPSLAALAEQAAAGLNHENRIGRLAPPLARRLYGTPLRTSVTRLEEFASCPFSHFAVHGLRLTERAEFGLDLPSLGLFTHGILRAVTGRLLKAGRDFAAVDAKEATALVEAAVGEALPTFAGGVLQSSPRYIYLARRLIRLLGGAVMILAEQARRGAFRTQAAELRFGSPGAPAGLSFNLPDGGQLALVGQIDRLDVASAEGRTYLRIVDYKSSTRRLSLEEVYHGLSLQLLVYLLAALTLGAEQGLKDPVPAGVFYFTLGERFLRTRGPLPPEEATARLLKEFRLEGLVRGEAHVVRLLDGDAVDGRGTVVAAALKKDGTPRRSAGTLPPGGFDVLLSFVRYKVTELATAALAGETAAAPVKQDADTACRYCALHAVCGFDPLLPGYAYRLLPRLKSEELWQRLERAVEEGDRE
ncbi:MAG TPA: helicase-exonuclease AddAB subunit AddB, partial [Firmicutes bacterium]|nr:helicase-exonuclease AddAB subunit AddB [Bacillota bacterium]